MPAHIKLYEEFFWQREDNDIAEKIIGYLDEIEINNLTHTHEHGGIWKYFYNINRGENLHQEEDPFGEEFWENDQIRICSVRNMELPFGNCWYELFVEKNGKQIKVKTNKAKKIYKILDSFYKRYNRQRDREELEGL